MAKEQSAEENKRETAKTEPPKKKKKITAVFHKQNSAQNSLKSRPGGSSGQRKPGSKPAGKRPASGRSQAAKPGENAARQPARRPAPTDKKASEKKPVKTEAEEKEKKNALPREHSREAGPSGTGKTAAADKAKPKTSNETAAPTGTKKGTAAEGNTPAKAEPEKPVRRFVDMEQVRAEDRAERSRTERAKNQNRNGNRGSQGSGTRTAGARTAGSRGGQESGGAGAGRSGQGGGFRSGASSGGAGTGRSGQNAGRSSGQKAGGSFGRGASGKPQSQKNGSKNQKGSSSRFNKNDSDEMRRPGGRSRGSREMTRPGKPVKKKTSEPEIKTIVLPASLTVKELADKMKIAPTVIIKKMLLAGNMLTVNQEIDFETASEIALEFDVLAEEEVQVDVIEELLKDTTEDKEEDLIPRPPVVCVMGHVDHGKTSLLDAIRNTNVTAGEAGGITQAIGASVVEINGQKITFLDTPGHEAFTAMRMRGAQATDIAILVVAADDGVMPQTIEAINHAKAAGVEIIVAINKIDKPGADVERVKQQLTEQGLVSEEWGGNNIFVPVSAKTGEGIDTLLESILLVAEVLELKANPNRRARGMVIEARLDRGRGPVATVLVQKGTLHVGDMVAAGSCYGRIRAMMDPRGRRVKSAGPSDPVEILGLDNVPGAGEIFVSPETEKEARNYAETFISEAKKKLLDDTKARMSLDDLFSQIQAGSLKELNLIIKADVQGSGEALKTSLLKLSNDEVVVKVIHDAAGAITESDVTLASASNAIIIGFNVGPDAQAKQLAESEQVDIRLYDVIYKAIEDVDAAMKGMLDPIYEEQILGHAVVRQLFKASAVGTIAGSYVTDGKIVRGCKCRVTRGGEQLFDGNLASLKRFKDDVKEVLTGFECGLVLEKFNNIQVDDIIEAYTMVEVPRS